MAHDAFNVKYRVLNTVGIDFLSTILTISSTYYVNFTKKAMGVNFPSTIWTISSKY